jgi:hypothetical protein
MLFRPITLEDKPLFNHYLSRRETPLITYNFSNFYMWRNWDPYAWAETDNSLVITSGYHDLDTICVPIAAKDADILSATETMIELYAKENKEFIISEVYQQALELYQKHWPQRFAVEEYPPGANYIYRRKDLAELPGKRYHAKRNHINNFKREYPDYQLAEFDKPTIAGCKDLLAQWLAKREPAPSDLTHEYDGCMDALNNYHALDCDGAAIIAHNQVLGFALGEPLNSDTYAIHIEKADASIRGAYQIINQLFAERYAADYAYINRAEDMGEPGLQQAKES